MLDYLTKNGYKFNISVSASVLQNIFKNNLTKSVHHGRTHAAKFKDYMCVSTQSRKVVNLVTNIFNVFNCDKLQKVDAKKVLTFYDDHKRKADQFNALFTQCMNKHRYQNVESNLVNGYLSMILTNSFIVYSSIIEKPLNHKNFLLQLSKELLCNKFIK